MPSSGPGPSVMSAMTHFELTTASSIAASDLSSISTSSQTVCPTSLSLLKSRDAISPALGLRCE